MSAQPLQSSPTQVAAPTLAQMGPPSVASGRTRSRRILQNFKGFEEEYNGPSALVAESLEIDPIPASESQSQGLFVSQDSGADHEDALPSNTQGNGRKRGTPLAIYEEDQDVMNDVAPAAQAFKKRKLAEASARRRRGESTPPPVVQPKDIAKPKTKSKSLRKEIDVQEVLAQKQAEATRKAEELARIEREALHEQLDGMPIEDIRNLAIVEEMTVTRQAPPPRTTIHADESDRWDERWNGRRNYKKFRRRGADLNDRRWPNRVIVQLEEVKKKDFGIGDEYWLEDTNIQRRRKKGKGKETQEPQSQAEPRQQMQVSGDRSEEASGTEEDGVFMLRDDDDANMAAASGVEVATSPSKPAARSQSGSQLADKTQETQNLPTQRGKRAAAISLSKPAPAKRVKVAPVVVERSDDDSDDDGLKFRFTRRK